MLKNITFSADEILIRRAREKAEKKHSTLNNEFRDWLSDYAHEKDVVAEVEAFYERTKHVRVKKKLTREEMNER